MGHRVVFIKLVPKHASKDKIELAVFEVLREFLLAVRDSGLQLAVLGSKLRLAVLFLVHSVGYSTHTSKHVINTSTQDLPAELEGKNNSINRERRNKYYLGVYGWAENK
jgi:hypothetical protein